MGPAGLTPTKGSWATNTLESEEQVAPTLTTSLTSQLIELGVQKMGGRD